MHNALGGSPKLDYVSSLNSNVTTKLGDWCSFAPKVEGELHRGGDAAGQAALITGQRPLLTLACDADPVVPPTLAAGCPVLGRGSGLVHLLPGELNGISIHRIRGGEYG